MQRARFSLRAALRGGGSAGWGVGVPLPPGIEKLRLRCSFPWNPLKVNRTLTFGYVTIDTSFS